MAYNKRRRTPYKRKTAKPYRKRFKLVQDGRTRTGGYYGRFQKNGETKFFDDTVPSLNITATAVILDSPNLIPQGVTESTRVGRKCTLKSIMWQGEIHLNLQTDDATPTGDFVRLICYWDKQCNGANATATDILQTDNWNEFNNLANSQRFKILWNKTLVFNHTAGAGASTAANVWPIMYKRFKFMKKCNIPLEFSATSGAIATVKSNNIGLLAISRNGECDMLYKTRVRFTDN